MEFSYVKCDGSFGAIYRPYLPITLSFGKKSFPVGHALVDTGSDMTILPLEIAHQLEIQLDDTKSVLVGSAGGGGFRAMPSLKKLDMQLNIKVIDLCAGQVPHILLRNNRWCC